MKKTYKITLPKRAEVKFATTRIVDGKFEVAVEFKDKYVPKDGDIVCDPVSCCGVVAICAGTNKAGGIKTHAAYLMHEDIIDARFSEDGLCETDNCRPATEAEKQRLFDALAKQGKRWNAEKKCVEDVPRWRAKRAAYYYFVNIPKCEAVYGRDHFYAVDDLNYQIGNYFRTREAAEKVASQIRDIFKNSKAE